MNPGLNPDQRNQIKTWVQERDEILGSIVVLKSERDSLVSENTKLGQSNKEIQVQINQAEGRLDELNKREEEYEVIVHSKIVELESDKTRLETTVTGLLKEILHLEESKRSIVSTIDSLASVYEKVFVKAGSIEKVIVESMEKNSKNLSDISTIVAEIKKTGKEIVDLNTNHLRVSEDIAWKLPTVFMNIQKKTIEKHPSVRKIVGTP